jgi:hypothetical protein
VAAYWFPRSPIDRSALWAIDRTRATVSASASLRAGMASMAGGPIRASAKALYRRTSASSSCNAAASCATTSSAPGPMRERPPFKSDRGHRNPSIQTGHNRFAGEADGYGVLWARIAASAAVASRRTRSSASRSARRSAGIASLASGPMRRRALATVTRTSRSPISSAAARAGTHFPAEVRRRLRGCQKTGSGHLISTAQDLRPPRQTPCPFHKENCHGGRLYAGEFL